MLITLGYTVLISLTSHLLIPDVNKVCIKECCLFLIYYYVLMTIKYLVKVYGLPKCV